MLAFEPGWNCLVDAAALLLTHAQSVSDDAGDQLGIGDRRKVDEPNPVGIVIEQFGADLDRKARLADAARTNEREQAVMIEQCLDLRPRRGRGRRTSCARWEGYLGAPETR